MPYRYFGVKNQTLGRPLWEILMNLKNFGKGRIVTRTATVKKYPEVPSFYKIVAVHPHIMDYPQNFRGNLLVEEVFCGRKRAEVIDIGEDAGTCDYQLVSKTEEPEILRRVEQFLANPENHKPIMRPKTAPLPPVWKLIFARENNTSVKDVPEIPIVYDDPSPEISHPTKIAEGGETPDFRIGPGHFKPVHEEFYEHVVFNREAAIEKYRQLGPAKPDFIYADKGLRYNPLHLEKKKSSSSSAQV